MARKARGDVLVIGLGRFGGTVAQTLVELGHEVLAIDADAVVVQQWSGQLTHVVEADSTREDVLRQLAVPEFERAIVAIGSDMEASMLTTALLADLGIPVIWAKAQTRAHGRILERLGATHVVFPEHEMGARVAHMLIGRMREYIEFEKGFALVETTPPADIVGKTLQQAQTRSRYGVTVVCIKRAGEDFTYATADSLITEDALLIVAGQADRAEAFANRT